MKQVRPLIEQVERVLNETNGAVKGADPGNRLSNKAKRNMQDHKATPEEQRLAEALKTVRTISPVFPAAVTSRSFCKKSRGPSTGPKINLIPSPRPRKTLDHS